jgi:hypothetical protein
MTTDTPELHTECLSAISLENGAQTTHLLPFITEICIQGKYEPLNASLMLKLYLQNHPPKQGKK